MEREWYREDVKKILDLFRVSPDRGLTNARVIESRKKYGSNILSKEEVRSVFDIFISQFQSPLIYVLFVAAIIVFFLDDFLEAIVIIGIIVVNSIVGTIQEGKAQNTLAALNRVVKSYVLVLREGREQKIPDYELVPGDILLLKDGEAIGADARIIECNSLTVNESSLTGESTMVQKTTVPLTAVALASADQVNMVFRGTYVVAGLAKAIVVRTGTRTVIGSISKKLSDLHMDVPLKRNIHNLSKLLVYVVLIVAALIFILGLRAGYGLLEMFTTVVAISVSAIPESLPVVVTLVLATGVWRMSKQNVLVKKLQAVEALGQAKVIALDKTGTITKNQMVVERMYINGDFLTVSGLGYEPKGALIRGHQKIDPDTIPGFSVFMRAASLTAIADIIPNKTDGEWTLQYGDPTEAALLVLAQKFGYEKIDLTKKFPKILEIPFDMRHKHHTAVHTINKKPFLMTVGGPELILKHSSQILFNGKSRKLTKKDTADIESALATLSKGGYRVLGIGVTSKPPSTVDAQHLPPLTFVGFVGITDAIRPEVKDSVRAVRNAGMKVLMITGDHVDTAIAIAKRVSIYEDGDRVMSGIDMNAISDTDLPKAIEGVTVFARVTPNDKLRVIEAYKRRGETIAMTGDGVNDALSLVAADLGVAMGKVGTEVAREASDIVLLDDKFANIVSAAEEGRNIYSTIRKTIVFLFATHAGEILLIILAVSLALPLPLSPIQILWLNLITETVLVAALALEPKEKNLLGGTFLKPSRYILDRYSGARIIFMSVIMSITTLFVFIYYIPIDMAKAVTMSLSVLTIFTWYNIFNVRSHNESIFSRSFFDNKYIVIGLLGATLLHVFAIYTPFMQRVLETTGLTLLEWLFVLMVGLVIVAAEELRKLVSRTFAYQK